MASDVEQQQQQENLKKDEEMTSKQEEIERNELEIFIKDLENKINNRAKLRLENRQCIFPPEEFFSRLDSSLKKNTAFVKKLKQFTAGQLQTLLKDMSGLNLNKYISEICTALIEAKLKMTDVQAVITLTSKLHQTYIDFDSQFLEAWQKNLITKNGDKYMNPSKMRVDLRLFADLISSGVINTKQGLSLLGVTLTNIITQSKDDPSNYSIILSFCRHCGEEYAGLISKNIFNLAQKYQTNLPKSEFLSKEKQQNVKLLLKEYLKNLSLHLKTEYSELLQAKRSIHKIMESKGEVSQERREKCESMQLSFDKLQSSVQTLADLLDEPLPELPKDKEDEVTGMVLDRLIDDQNINDLDPWGDEETKAFYTELPDLRLFLPNFSAPKLELNPIEEGSVMTDDALDLDIEPEHLDVDDPPSNSSDPLTPIDSTCSFDEIGLDQVIADDSQKSLTNITAPRMFPMEKSKKKHQFEQFLNNLNNCVNTELINSAAIEFLLMYNTKNNRKKLTKTIYGVQRTRLDLLPFLSRFVAIINLVNRDVAIDLAHMLKMEFKWHIKKKNQMNIESKIKIVRFIGEMVKFGIFPKIEGLFCLKILLHDFQHHQIEMACAFFEVAGVYLFNCPDTRIRTNVYLEQMIRLKTVTALDSRYSAQIESVYYLVKPPQSISKEKIIRPVLHEYIRHLIFEELCKVNVDKCIKLLRRLNWKDPIISSYTIKCLSKAYLLRFPLIRCLADLVSGLSSYQEKCVTKVIDIVFEDIRAGLEIHSPKLAQRRIAMAKYLGELYNYKLIESWNILNTLYSIISLGVSTEDGVESPLDPPDSLFRLKLVCVLLDTSGQYFTSTKSRKRLDYYLIFFQHYYWFKKSNPIFSRENSSDLFPILIDHMYGDCLHNIRPKLKQFKSYEEAKQAVEKLKLELYPQLLSGSNDDTGIAESTTDLTSIREDSEADELTGGDTSEAVVESDDEFQRLDDDDLDNDDDSPVDRFNDMIVEVKKSQPTKEDLEFEQMFEKMATDSYQERLRETVKPTTKDIPVPMMAKTAKKNYNQIQSTATNYSSNSSSNHSTDDNRNTETAEVPFVLMLRSSKGSKQLFKQFNAPSDSPLAINLKLQEQKIREENEKVKRLTLCITDRIEEEDYQESLLLSQKNQTQMNHRLQRTRQPKFRHQKGAPDVDLIFN